MTHRTAWLLTTVVLLGCYHPVDSLRPRAAADLECAADQLSFEELGGDCGIKGGELYHCSMRARGCGQIATYVHEREAGWVRYHLPVDTLRPRVAHDFSCPDKDLSFKILSGDCRTMHAENYHCTFGVSGCGMMATYVHAPGTSWVRDGEVVAQGPGTHAVASAGPASAVRASSPTGVPRSWLVAIGISRYRRPAISLRYAARDAKAVHDFFSSAAGGSIPRERRVLLTDDAATRSAVLDALTNTARRTAPEDLLIVYLALHGLPDAGGDLYLLTHDTDPNRLIGTGLAQRDVEYGLSKAGAKRIVLLADACHSGAVGLAKPGKRGLVLAETNRLIRQLADTRPGTALLTASSASEFSFEGDQWDHGVFTFHLLEGLRGKGDANGDRLVTVRELFDFVYREVSEATGGKQHPEIKGTFDNALPLSQLE